MPGMGAPTTPVPDVPQKRSNCMEPMDQAEQEDGDQSSLHDWNFDSQFEPDTADGRSHGEPGHLQ